MLIIALVLVAVTGSLFYVVRSKNDKKAVTSFEECAALGNPIREIYPEQCVADGKTFTNPKQKLNDTDIQKPTKVFKIPELGVQFDTPEELNNLYYIVSPNNPNVVEFSLSDLKGTECEAGSTSLALLIKMSSDEVDKDVMYMNSKSELKQINGFYFTAVGSQSACSDDNAIQDKATAARKNILEAIKSSLTSIQ